jgi:hypothetical protein
MYAQCLSVHVDNYTKVFSFDWGATYVENQDKVANYSKRYSFTLSTRYTFAKGYTGSIGLELPAVIGAVPFYKEDPKKLISLPLFLNANLGQDGAAIEDPIVGIFIGGGYGYHYQFEKDKNSETNIRRQEFMGPAIQGGVRLKIPNMKIINSVGNSIALTARGYAHFNPKNAKGNVYGIGLLISLLGDADERD